VNEIVLLHKQKSCPIITQCAVAPPHSNRAKFGITVLFLCILGLLGPIPSFCQMALNPERTGVVPYGAYESNGIDHIDMSNGRVYLSIPLYSLPQRGALSLSFSVIVSGATTYDAQAKNCTETSCEYDYKLTNGIGPRIVFDQALRLMPVVATRNNVIEAGLDIDGVSQIENSSMEVKYIHQVMDGAGNLHYLGFDPSTNYTTLRSADGSGYLEQLSDPNGYKDGATGPIYDAKGIRYDSTGITDPNGNHITYPSPTDIITDSLGRSVSLPGAGTAVDVSNCPDLNNPSQPVTSAYEWDLPGPTDAGGTTKYIICDTEFYYHTNLLLRNGESYYNSIGDPPVANTYNEAASLVTPIQSIVNPDGTYWSFEYDATQDPSAVAFGDLLKVHLPSGGTITYTYQTLPTCTPEEEGYPRGNVNPPFEPYSRVVTGRTLTQLDGSTQSWSYAYLAGFPNLTSVVGRPDGSSTAYEFSPLGESSECSYVETSRKDYHGSFTTGVLKRTTEKTYFTQDVPQFVGLYQKSYGYAWVQMAGGYRLFADIGQLQPLEIPFLHTVTTTVDQGPPTTTTYAYDAGFTNVQPFCILSDSFNQDSCDWNFTYRTAHAMLGRVTSVSTTGSDGHGGTLTSTKTTSYQAFDSTGVTNSAYYNANLLDFPHVVSLTGSAGNIRDTTYNYDESNGSPAGVHGNLTSTVVNGGAPTSTVYGTDGMPTKSIDGNGNTTQYTYGDASSASPTSVCMPSTNGTSHCSSYTWDPNTGEMVKHTDQNGVITQYTYNDGLGRVTKVDAAVGTPSERTTTFNYGTPNVTNVSADKDVLGDGKLTSSVTVDGFGRQIRTTNAAGAMVDTTYDSVGNIASVSNPYFSTSDPTYGITSLAYDALGRKTYQCQQDNSSTASTTCTPGNSYQQWQYNGNVVTFSDESGKKWVRTSDALGRLAEVVEDPSSSNFETDYQYDSLGNLTSVTQWGGPNGSPNPRTRTFSYDSLSELVQSYNPETGWTCYGTTPSNAPASGSNCTRDYDGNSNLRAKTDARGVTTNYAYDPLNRLIGKTYTNAPAGTLSSCYQYDTATDGDGRLGFEWTQSGNCPAYPGPTTPPTSGYQTLHTIVSYYPMGRVKEEQQCAPGSCTTSQPAYSLQYTYNLAGGLTSYKNGNDSILYTNYYDDSGRLSKVTSTLTGPKYPTPLFSSPTYSAGGRLTSAIYGTGTDIALCRWYDKRLRITGEVDTGATTESAANCPAEQPQ
jgi:YD repeat-containing protein